MKRAIFLTASQKSLLDDLGLSVEAVLPENRDEHFSSSDIRTFETNTYVLGQQGKPLAMVGFPSDEDVPVYVPEAVEPVVQETLYSEWDAECPTTDCIVIWPKKPAVISGEEEECCKELHTLAVANSMLRRNLRTIVKAMSKVMSFKELATTKQFELSVLKAI